MNSVQAPICSAKRIPARSLRLWVSFAVGACGGFCSNRTAPDLAVVNGPTPTLLSSLRGNIVVVMFIDTTCGPCGDEARTLAALNAEFNSRGLRVFGVAFNESATNEEIKRFITDYGVNYPVTFATQAKVREYLHFNSQFVVPQVLIVDRNGGVQAQSHAMGTPQLQKTAYLRNMIKDLISRGAGGAAADKSIEENDTKASH